MTEKKILLVDDEKRFLDSLSKRISLLGFVPIKASSGFEAIEAAKKTAFDLAVVDLKMPDMDGLVTITKLKEILPDLRTVLLTGYGSEKVRQATEALGSTYIEKDVMGNLWDMIKQSSRQGHVVVIKPDLSDQGAWKNPKVSNIEIMDPRQYAEINAFKREPLINEKNHFPENPPKIIGDTVIMQRLKKNISRFAHMDCTIVIKGESGTGKELVAKTIHHMSIRQHSGFLAFDCGCFSSDFNFGELFNCYGDFIHKTRSEKNSPILDSASFSGTVFLDRIENMPEPVQLEMMELLEQKNSQDRQGADVRFMVAADEKIEEKIFSGKFNSELFRRLRGIEMVVPPLRNHIEDLPILVKYFLNQLNSEHGTQVKSVSEKAFKTLEAYSFPGNIRELRHIIERAVILTDDNVIDLMHLPERIKKNRPQTARKGDHSFLTIQEMEKKHILDILENTGGNKSKASEILGISRAALWRKLKLYND